MTLNNTSDFSVVLRYVVLINYVNEQWSMCIYIPYLNKIDIVYSYF